MADGRVERGNQTRRAVLDRTMSIASVDGLEGLSLGKIAADLGLSKSGVFALFGSKEDLQLATVRAAVDVFRNEVVQPVHREPDGLSKVWRLCERWLGYSGRRVFPGGCFFYSVSAEFDARPGRSGTRSPRCAPTGRVTWSACWTRRGWPAGSGTRWTPTQYRSSPSS